MYGSCHAPPFNAQYLFVNDDILYSIYVAAKIVCEPAPAWWVCFQ